MILLEEGWGWWRFKEDMTSEAFTPPRALLLVHVEDFIRPSENVIGVSGTLKSAHPEFDGLAILVFTHTCEFMGGEDPAPLAFTMSPQVPKLSANVHTLFGYTMIPQGHPAFQGYGLLVPAAIQKGNRP